MDSERIPCGLPTVTFAPKTVTSPPKGQASEYDKTQKERIIKNPLQLRTLWQATGNINLMLSST